MIKKDQYEEENYLVVDTTQGENGEIYCIAEDLESAKENVERMVQDDIALEDIKVYRVAEVGEVKQVIDFD